MQEQYGEKMGDMEKESGLFGEVVQAPREEKGEQPRTPLQYFKIN